MVSVVSQDVAFAPKLEDLMLVNGQMLTLHEHLQARRKAKPTDAWGLLPYSGGQANAWSA